MSEKNYNYKYVIKYGDNSVLKNYIPEFPQAYGSISEIDIPLTSSIAIEQITGSDRRRIHALKNALDRNIYKSQHFACTSGLGDKLTQDLTLISIPSIFFGSSIQKGTVELEAYYSGTLVAKINDSKYNGELIETTGSNSGSVAGVVLYDHGFIILTGSWNIHNGIFWNCFNSQEGDNLVSASYNFRFDGTTEIPTLTMLAHAPKGEYNHSNNPTYLKYNQEDYSFVSSSNLFHEPSNVEIKNITKYQYDNFSGSLEKHVYISKIGIFDEKKNLIGIAKLAKPIKKTIDRDYTFKLKLDL